MTELEEKLGERAYVELKELVRGSRVDWSSLKGAMKSWTIRAGVLVTALPDLVSVLPEAIEYAYPDLVALIGEDSVKMMLRMIGVAMILLRIKTTKPLKERS